MDTGTAIASAIGLVTVLIAGYGLRWQIRSTTAADRARAAEMVAQQIRDARQEERDRCSAVKQTLERSLAEMTTDRNSERARADQLQALINNRGLGGSGS